MNILLSFGATMLQWLAYALILGLLVGLAALVATYIRDVSQTKSSLRRNYPVIARFRYLFEHIGKFFRQYFYAMDREELPFNRAERSWCYQAAKNVDTTIAFGSTRDLKRAGTVYFVHSPFPPTEEELEAKASTPHLIHFGPYCKTPYATDKYFNISGMSYGAISKPAIQALSRGAHKAGIWMNTGEGGLSPYHLEGGADIIFQFGTGKFGVCDDDGNLDDDKLREVTGNASVKMVEIKMSQGAKPGKGGLLPAAKVVGEIARIRGLKDGEPAVSPNRFPEIRNVSDLLDMVERVRSVSGKPTGLKFCLGSQEWLEELCLEIHIRGIESAPDFLTVDSADGGTGAAPMALIDTMGMPVRESLPFVIDTLKAHGLRERVRVGASGKLVTPVEVAWALAMGADYINSGRGFLFALGCIQALQCNRNTCPTGITTHDPKLQRGLVPADKAERVAHYAKNMRKEVLTIAHSCGVDFPHQLTRKHARIVLETGRSEAMSEIYPPIKSA